MILIRTRSKKYFSFQTGSINIKNLCLYLLVLPVQLIGLGYDFVKKEEKIHCTVD